MLFLCLKKDLMKIKRINKKWDAFASHFFKLDYIIVRTIYEVGSKTFSPILQKKYSWLYLKFNFANTVLCNNKL